MTASSGDRRWAFHGPWCWALSAAIGLAAGVVLTHLAPGGYSVLGPDVRPWLLAPFVLLLAGIAFAPFIHARLWHLHYPDVAFALAGLVAGYYYTGFGPAPQNSHSAPSLIAHALAEYYAFIALVGGLFVVSGGILVDVRGRGT